MVLHWTEMWQVSDWKGDYNSTLTGVDGRQYGYINDDSDVEQTIIAAVNGKSIQTSIDIGAQQIVEKYVNGFKEGNGGQEYRCHC